MLVLSRRDVIRLHTSAEHLRQMTQHGYLSQSKHTVVYYRLYTFFSFFLQATVCQGGPKTLILKFCHQLIIGLLYYY